MLAVGVLIEPNILERRKEVIGRKPSFTNRVFSNADDFDNGILITRVISGSDDLFFSTKIVVITLMLVKPNIEILLR